ncbi:MAG: T9SS type A sorting domain-containing protein [Chitinophagaceae bacterium]|nr:T9SS type A sorting domain-containing protein [Chitinophagaceae bacterium]MCW5905853.1 T9SS type A sorting domain-containing protein [Chitinophagaceae bacterium]
MNKFYKTLLTAIICIAITTHISYAQSLTNRGTEFWVGYGPYQAMETGNNQNMVLYFSTEADTALVTVTIDSSGTGSSAWQRIYKIPPFTSISTLTDTAFSYTIGAGKSGAMPKTGTYDCRLYSPASPVGSYSTGIFSRKGIHIESNVPILAYTHIYGTASSGATTLMPIEAWGVEYLSINNKQVYGPECFSWLYVIAQENDTQIEIIPSVPYVTNSFSPNTPNTNLAPFYVTLQKGQIYVMRGGLTASGSSTGYELTGTRVTSVSGKKIAAFSGSSRTTNPAVCGTGGGDNDMQQLFPMQTWGKKYVIAPTSSSTSPSNFMTNIYRIVVADSTTVVLRNGTTLTDLIAGTYYTFESNNPEYIEADKPIMIGQSMGGAGCLGAGGGNMGDPEIFYVSPVEQRIKKTAFYRNNIQAITTNYVTIIVPTDGLASLKIDSVLFSNIPSLEKHSYTHPTMAGYSVAIKRWSPAGKAIVRVESDSAFSGITYGLGSVESYGYNIGAHTDSIGPMGFRLFVLPANITYFNAVQEKQNALLTWSATTETNVLKYEIERSLNGTSFEYAGFVQAKNAEIYNYTDVDILKKYADNKILYYRIKITDKDGSFKYSGIVKLNINNNRENVISVYPNPFTTQLWVNISAEKNTTAYITIKDITGRTLIAKTVAVTKGSNNVILNEAGNLQKGVYMLSVNINDTVHLMKVVK